MLADFSGDPGLMAGWEGTLLKMARQYAGGTKAITAQQSKELHAAYLSAVRRGVPLPVFDGGAMKAGQYMLADLQRRTTYPAGVVFAWLRALYEGVRSGKIARSHYDPAGAQEAVAARKGYASERTGLESFTATAARGFGAIGGTIKGVLFLAIVAGAALLWYRSRPADSRPALP